MGLSLLASDSRAALAIEPAIPAQAGRGYHDAPGLASEFAPHPAEPVAETESRLPSRTTVGLPSAAAGQPDAR